MTLEMTRNCQIPSRLHDTVLIGKVRQNEALVYVRRITRSTMYEKGPYC